MNRSAELRRTEAGWHIECKLKGKVIRHFIQPFVIILNEDFSLLIVKRIAIDWINLGSIVTNPVWNGEKFDSLESLQMLRGVLSASRAIDTEHLQ